MEALQNRIYLAAMLVLLLISAACATNPVTGEQQLAMMSEADEVALGKQAYPQAIQQYQGPPPQDPELQRYVSKVGDKLARVSHRPHLPWEFIVVNSDEINAFALPGGKVAITRGLLTRFDSEDELAYVLGHEIGHATARHHVSQHARSSLMSLGVLGVGIALGGSGWGGVAQQAAGTVGGLTLLSYSRDQERQADDLGSEYMIKAGYNPKAQLEVMQLFENLRTSEPSFVETLLATHPMDSERIANAKARLAKLPASITSRPLKTKAFEQAMATQRKRAPAYREAVQGDKVLQAKRYSVAARHYAKASKLYGGDGIFDTKRAVALWQGGQRNQALKAAGRGAYLSPGLLLTQNVKAQLNAKAKHWLPAAEGFEGMTVIVPQSAELQLYAGYCYEQAGKNQQAAQRYRRAMRLDPYGKYGQTASQRLRELPGY